MRQLLIDGAAGIYVPRNFYERFDFSEWNLNIADFSDLSDPYKEHYWDAWQDVLDQAEHHDNDGRIWRLEQDGDLWAVCDEGEENDHD